jgi:hypothetical protein
LRKKTNRGWIILWKILELGLRKYFYLNILEEDSSHCCWTGLKPKFSHGLKLRAGLKSFPKRLRSMVQKSATFNTLKNIIKKMSILLQGSTLTPHIKKKKKKGVSQLLSSSNWHIRQGNQLILPLNISLVLSTPFNPNKKKKLFLLCLSFGTTERRQERGFVHPLTTMQRGFVHPTLSPSILRISLSYFYAFRGFVILSLSLSLFGSLSNLLCFLFLCFHLFFF